MLGVKSCLCPSSLFYHYIFFHILSDFISSLENFCCGFSLLNFLLDVAIQPCGFAEVVSARGLCPLSPFQVNQLSSSLVLLTRMMEIKFILLSGDAHARRPLHKMDGVFFFRFVGQLLEHPVWRHLPLPAH